MGKGAGNICGRPQKSTATADRVQPPPAEVTPVVQEAATTAVEPVQTSTLVETTPPATVQAPIDTPAQKNVETDTKMAKIYIIFYSMYGHIYKMAQAMKEGVDSVEGCEAVLYQVAETLPSEVLEKMHAPPKPDVPVIDRNDLPNADGLIFGFPTRFSMMSSQMKSFFDSTGQLWQSGALVGKPATLFTSTATQGGGQEVTIFTAVTQLVHHGMVYVPPGYSMGGSQFQTETAEGGSPWGAGCLAGVDGSRQPSDKELSFAKHQGAHFAKVAKKLAA